MTAMLGVPAGARAVPLWEVGPAYHVLPELPTFETLISSGELVLYEVGKVSGAKCKIEDEELIWNPVGGGAGEDTMEKWEGECHGSAIFPCTAAEHFKVKAFGSPSKLLAATEDEIKVPAMELECPVSLKKETYAGVLIPKLGVNKLNFSGAASGTLKGGVHEIDFKGKEKLKAVSWAKVRG